MDSGLSGVELCAIARARFPEVVRLLVTGYADVSTLGSGINDGQIRGYIAKPWREDEMVSTLRKAIAAHHAGALVRNLEMATFRRHQLSVSSLVVGDMLRALCNPATAARDNLEASLSSLPDIGVALRDGPEAVVRGFRELERTLADGLEAAETLASRMSAFRLGEAAPFPTAGVAPLDLGVEIALQILREEARKSATLCMDLEVRPWVAVAPAVVTQISLNLLVTAVEHITVGRPRENRIDVSTFVDDRVGGVFGVAATDVVRSASSITKETGGWPPGRRASTSGSAC